ncbi:hypothetical protein KC367_g8789 [Hortaea werneckii]|nr:hypothetical protein KC367_g8789 [Hortaea werneckii]
MAAAYGIGNHQWLLTSSDLRQGNKWNWIGRIVGIVAATLGKNVVIALLLRMQGQTHRRKAWILHFVWATNAVLCLVIIVVLCLRCRPIEMWWDKSLDGTCNAIDSSTTQVLGTFQGSWMAASDFVLALYPISIFWDLQMSWKRKAGLCALMGGGIVAGICGALKTVQVQQAYASQDVSYNLYPLLVTTLVEGWMILILASIPPLRPLLAQFIRKSKSSILGHSTPGAAGSQTGSRTRSVELATLSQNAKGWAELPGRSYRKQGAENDSEEEILPSGEHDKCNFSHVSTPVHRDTGLFPGIKITRDYDVHYQSKMEGLYAQAR